MGQPLHRVAADGGVGGDHAVHAVALQRGGNHAHLLLAQVRGDLHKDGYAPALGGSELFTVPGHGAKQAVQRLVALQRAQVLRVGRADVHRHIVGMRVHALQAGQVVARGVLDGRAGVLADVQAQQQRLALPAHLGLLHVGDEGVQPLVVEAQAVDQGARLGQAEHARLGVARLALGRDGAHLDEAKTHGGQAVNAARVLVQAGGQTHAVGKTQAG